LAGSYLAACVYPQDLPKGLVIKRLPGIEASVESWDRPRRYPIIVPDRRSGKIRLVRERFDRYRRYLVVAVRSGEGPSTEHITARADRVDPGVRQAKSLQTISPRSASGLRPRGHQRRSDSDPECPPAATNIRTDAEISLINLECP
jgi:hypothetical protein